MANEDAERAVDVVVVGGGGTGMAAALSAREAGAEVLVLERQTDLGGVTARSIGSYSVAESDLQAEAGIEDSVEAHFDDIDKFVANAAEAGHFAGVTDERGLRERDRLDLRRRMVELGPDTFDWLRDHGLEYSGPHPEPPHRVPRMHNVTPNTRAYRDVLGEAVREAGVDVRTDTAVAELLTEDGAVVGVRDDADRTYRATGGVVLATGGYYANQELRSTYTANDSAPPITDHGLGAGHEMARAVGAELVNMDLQWLSFRVGEPLWTSPEVERLTAAGAVLVAPDGDRYVNERSDGDQVIDATLDAGGTCYVVFDEPVASQFAEWPDFVSTFPGIAYGYVDDYAETEYLESGETAEALAAACDFDVETFEATLSVYNAAARGQRVDRFGRSAIAGPLDSAPYYALGPVGAYSLITDGGVAVNTHLEALDGEGSPIEGLYAAGDTAGGPLRVGHGHHHLWLFNSGRIAGNRAAGGNELPD
jgi:succinate dehydrogenase/fumarate reductase flavoprotein subunit